MKPFLKKLSQTILLGSALATFAAGCDGDRAPVGPVGPDVGLFLNGDYVGANFDDGSDWETGDEGSNLFATLAYAGYNPLPFTSIDATDIQDTLEGKGAIVIPEQEDGDLAADLSDEAAGALTDYVHSGGLIVINGTWPGEEDPDEAIITETPALINRLLGTSVSNSLETGNESGEPVVLRIPTPVDTIFDSGPDSLPSNDGTYPLLRSSLPSDAVVVYGTEESAHVVIFPHGNGAIVFLAYDWYDAEPAGDQDNGWLKVLGLALEYRGVLPPEGLETVALFMNSYFVEVDFRNGVPEDDEDQPTDAEASNEYYTLLGLGYHVVPWVEPYTSATDLALGSGARVVVIPEPEENEGLRDYLDDNDSWYLLSEFIGDGGTLILHGDDCGDNREILEYLIEEEIDCDSASEPIELDAEAVGTTFEDLASSISSANATTSLDPDDMTSSALVIYLDDAGYAPVLAIPYGDGAIIWIGYDWFDAAPLGSQDGGWLDALNAAIQFDPTSFD